MADYAIVESGGKQYRAEKGAALVVDRLPEDEGAKVDASPRPLPRRQGRRRERGRPREGQGRGGGVGAPARPEDPGLQVPRQEGLPAPRRAPLRAHEARGDRRQAADPQAGREGRTPKAEPAKKPAAKKPAAKAKKPAAKKPAAEEAGREEARGEEAGREEAGRQEARREGVRIGAGSAKKETARHGAQEGTWIKP